MSLEYFLSESNQLTVISLNGEIDDSVSSVLERCSGETLKLAPRAVVFQMGRVSEVARSGLRPLSQFLKQLKDRGATLRFSGLDAKAKELLLSQGILSTGEIKESPADAIKEAAEIVRPKDRK